MKNKRLIYLSAFLASALIVVVFIFNPFASIKFSGGQLANLYPAVTTPINPVSFWEFSGANPTAQKTPTVGSQQFGATETSTWTTGTGGKVGNFIDLSGSGNTAGNITPSANGWAVEFLFKPSRTFEAGTIFMFGSNFRLEFQTPVGGNPNGSIARWKVSMNGVESYIDLDGAGRKSLAYIANGNWHHFVVQYDPTSASQKVQFIIDGQLADGYSFNNTVSTTGSVKFSGMAGAEYTQCNCSLDQIALYDRALPPNLVLEHYNNINAGLAYSTTTNITNVPAADSVAGVYNPLDFMAGTNLSSSTGQTPGVSVSVIDQLKSYPLARYKPSNTLIRNFGNWLAYDYLANRASSSISGNCIGNQSCNHTKAKEINRQLATKWNYHIQVSSNIGSGNDGFGLADQALANEQQYITPVSNFIPIAATSFRGGGSSCGGNCIQNQNFPSNHYLQNSSGQFLSNEGNVTTNKIWRPVSTYLTDYAPDGDAAKTNIQGIIAGIPNRVAANPTKSIDIINENGEIFPAIVAVNTTTIVNNDPVVLAAKNASGLDAYTYVAKQFQINEKAYADKIKSVPSLANSVFTEYGQSGEHIFVYKWSESRQVNTQMNGQYYATPDFYIRYPWNWKYWASSWHGWQWLVNNRNGELPLGDNLYSPFTSAGWDAVERNNVRPAQMLGFTKILAATGAEFFYPGVFNIENPISNNLYPENYVWQASIPVYAQGVTSYYEDILRNGKLMQGDTTRWVYPPDTNPGFRFYTGNPGQLVVARKQNSANRFVISGMENPWSNYQGNVSEESVADIMFGGDTFPSTTVTPTENLKFKVRRQGSTYIYDKTGASPVFYQLDTWHESSHPWHWSKDFSFEAEVYDSGSASRTTTVPAGTLAGDYTNFTTYINPASGSTTYNFEPRNATGTTAKTYYLWYFAKSSTGTSTASVKVDSGTAQTLSTNSATFGWCNKNSSNTPIVFSGITPNTAHTFTFTGLSVNFQLDKFILTENTSLNLGACGPETIPPTVSITNPINNSSIVGGTVTNVTADATDASGIASVEFKVDGTSIGIDTTAPYSVSWNTAGVAGGVHSITALAIDIVGNQATSSVVDVNILAGTFVSITIPTDGSILFSGQTYPMQATVGGPITKVRYFRYDTSTNVTRKCASTVAPNFNCSWTPNGGLLNLTVDFLIHAKGYDAQGNVIATSPTITVTRTAGGGNRNSGGGSGRSTQVPQADVRTPSVYEGGAPESGGETIPNPEEINALDLNNSGVPQENLRNDSEPATLDGRSQPIGSEVSL